MVEIHPSAIVDPSCELDEGVSIGPYAVISGGVKIGKGTIIGAHTVIEGKCVIGAENKIGCFVHLGGAPQHLKYNMEETSLFIGDSNQIREFVTIHRGTLEGGGKTVIGNNNFFMVGCHIAHDCKIGNGIVMANYTQLGGHSEVFDYAVFGGLSGVHQRARVGRCVMVAALAGVSLDAPPFSLVGGERARWLGLNRVGLQRLGFSDEKVMQIRKAYRIIFSPYTLLEKGLEQASSELGDVPEVKEIIEFFKTSKRGVIRKR